MSRSLAVDQNSVSQSFTAFSVSCLVWPLFQGVYRPDSTERIVLAHYMLFLLHHCIYINLFFDRIYIRIIQASLRGANSRALCYSISTENFNADFSERFCQDATARRTLTNETINSGFGE